MSDAGSEQLVHVSTNGGICVAVIDAPPINVMTRPLFRELYELAERIDTDDSVRVLILRSANPEFFIAHFDVESLLSMRVDGELRVADLTDNL